MKNLLIANLVLVLGCQVSSGVMPARYHKYQGDKIVLHIWCDEQDPKQCESWAKMACPNGYTFVGQEQKFPKLHRYVICGGSHGSWAPEVPEETSPKILPKVYGNVKDSGL